MNRGLVQNLTIFLLLLSSLVLLSIRFELFVMSGNIKSLALEDKSSLRYAVRPTSIDYRIGPENSTKIVDKNGANYMEIARVLEESFKTKTSIEPMKESDYGEKKGSRSIQLNFEPTIDQRLLYGSLFLKDGKLGDFGRIREILVPQGYDTSIYLRLEDNQCLEIKNNSLNSIASFEQFGNLSDRKYYSIGERFPQYSDSNVLISDEVRLSSYVTKNLFTEENVDKVIRNIFGSKYDFANKISEVDGSTIVNYDYGREMIKISSEGKVFYVNNDASANDKPVGLTESLASAMRFVSALSGDSGLYVVEGVKDYNKGNNEGYEFSIAKREEGVRISLKNNHPIIHVAVVNGQVFSMEGLFRETAKAVDNRLAIGENAVLFMLERNLDVIKEAEPFETTNELFDNIRSVEYAYIYSRDYNYIACLKMVIGQTNFFFKIEDGQVV